MGYMFFCLWCLLNFCWKPDTLDNIFQSLWILITAPESLQDLFLFICLLVYLFSDMNGLVHWYPPPPHHHHSTQCVVSDIIPWRVQLCPFAFPLFNLLGWQWFQQDFFYHIFHLSIKLLDGLPYCYHNQLLASTNCYLIALFNSTLRHKLLHSLIHLNSGLFAKAIFEACLWGLLWPQESSHMSLFLVLYVKCLADQAGLLSILLLLQTYYHPLKCSPTAFRLKIPHTLF